MAERWFVSDWHLFHKNIIDYCQRPFKDEKEMTEALITYHNTFVKPQDHYSMLGDATILRGGKANQEQFIKAVKQFNGHGRLYLGNHDHFDIEVYLKAGFEKIYATWRSQENLLFSHIPVHPNSLGTARANVHGHIHNNEVYKPALYQNTKTGEIYVKPYINVCVEVINYHPINLDDVLARVDLAIKAAEAPDEKVPSSKE